MTPETDNAGRSLDWLASARLIAWLLAILLTASPAWPLSSDVQPLDSIRAAVEDFLHNQLDHNPDHRSSGPSTTTIEVGALDPRLTLNHCELPLSAFLAPGARPASLLLLPPCPRDCSFSRPCIIAAYIISAHWPRSVRGFIIFISGTA